MSLQNAHLCYRRSGSFSIVAAAAAAAAAISRVASQRSPLLRSQWELQQCRFTTLSKMFSSVGASAVSPHNAHLCYPRSGSSSNSLAAPKEQGWSHVSGASSSCIFTQYLAAHAQGPSALRSSCMPGFELATRLTDHFGSARPVEQQQGPKRQPVPCQNVCFVGRPVPYKARPE